MKTYNDASIVTGEIFSLTADTCFPWCKWKHPGKTRKEVRGPIVGMARNYHKKIQRGLNSTFLKASGTLHKELRAYGAHTDLIATSGNPSVKGDANAIAKNRLSTHWTACYKNTTKTWLDLTGLLKCRELWYAAYDKLNFNKGAKTSGVDGETFSGMSKSKILNIQMQVLKGTFQWSPIRRIYIPKTHPSKFRPLGIPTKNDRIVQEVLRIILEPIFEPTFKPTSFGFRPLRSCHHALIRVNTKFKACSWYIEGDITKCFDEIDHEKLMALVTQRVSDKRVLNLIRTGLKSRVISFKPYLNYEPSLGAPQGGVLSPLLSNIYLNQLDHYVDKLMKLYQGTKTAGQLKTNNTYRRLLTKGKKGLIYKLKMPSLCYKDPDYRHIAYVRYADDFLIGVNGNRNLALEIRNNIGQYLMESLNLRLNHDKTKITHISKSVPFLGYKLGRRLKVTRQTYKLKKYRRAMKVHTLNVDGKRVIQGLRAKGYCDGSGKPQPQFKWLRLPQSEINLKINFILRGLSQWWKYAGNRRSMLTMASFILRYSAAKLYAAKFKLGTVAKVFRKCGHDLGKPVSRKRKAITGVDDKLVENWAKSMTRVPVPNRKIPGIMYTHYRETPQTQAYPRNYQPKHEKLAQEKKFEALASLLLTEKRESTNPLDITHWRLARAVRVLNSPCIICGETKNVAMHHLKSVPIMKHEHRKAKHARQISTKQVPLCKAHHLTVGHQGNWQNKARKITRKLVQEKKKVKTTTGHEEKLNADKNVGEPRDK